MRKKKYLYFRLRWGEFQPRNGAQRSPAGHYEGREDQYPVYHAGVQRIAERYVFKLNHFLF